MFDCWLVEGRVKTVCLKIPSSKVFGEENLVRTLLVAPVFAVNNSAACANLNVCFHTDISDGTLLPRILGGGSLRMLPMTHGFVDLCEQR